MSSYPKCVIQTPAHTAILASRIVRALDLGVSSKDISSEDEISLAIEALLDTASICMEDLAKLNSHKQVFPVQGDSWFSLLIKALSVQDSIVSSSMDYIQKLLITRGTRLTCVQIHTVALVILQICQRKNFDFIKQVTCFFYTSLIRKFKSDLAKNSV